MIPISIILYIINLHAFVMAVLHPAMRKSFVNTADIIVYAFKKILSFCRDHQNLMEEQWVRWM